MNAAECGHHGRYELRFAHLFNTGKGYSFPCDADGRVDLDELSEAARSNYFFARGLIGRELSVPFTRELCSSLERNP